MGIKITGVVIHGKQLGRKLGFPTANIALTGDTAAQDGVYAAVATVDNVRYRGMANVGRPNPPQQAETSCSGTDKLLEINLFGFDGYLYGKPIEVELLERIRDEKHFGSAEELKAAVDDDRHTIQEYFKQK